MNSQSVITVWLEQLGRQYTGSPWLLNGEGVAAFQFDELEVIIEVDRDDSPVGIYVDLGVRPRANDRNWWLAMLKANSMVTRMDVATLSVHPNTQHMTLGYVLPVEWLDQSTFADFVLSLMEQAGHWHSNLEALQDELNQAGSKDMVEVCAQGHMLNGELGIYV